MRSSGLQLFKEPLRRKKGLEQLRSTKPPILMVPLILIVVPLIPLVVRLMRLSTLVCRLQLTSHQ